VIEQQIAEFVACFTPSAEVRDEVLARLADEHTDDADTVRPRNQLKDRRKRLAELFEMGDVNRAVYRSKRDAIDAELDSLAPGRSPTSTALARCLRTSAGSGRQSLTRSSVGSLSANSSTASGSMSGAWSRCDPLQPSRRSSSDAGDYDPPKRPPPLRAERRGGVERAGATGLDS
jgi:hypothetical protein